ncbi:MULTISPECIES: cell division protein FtsQ/DivIB [Vibrio]|uniref:cell division protein FtsQ/DivIB n=1 Tax=Vibrio TaxID=662 RepID=UPI002075E3C0|nr:MULTISPECIES: cell division protein FtsQ/DivIB [Vibrio]USD31991.1 cell division protein FtsQ/DivIB [Vibrio sp. SCSIO 43186]USD45033.1 cell division protein FtsQ/DivIB [Vibrio sp. SCSIO 43145]USD69114.1 cell division protein FtsQ/DivIB [Vibrio sp. SCSIO 43139]USD96802.1 cell division protein FtsQ [Vibrio coralliilyticus]
MIESTLDEGRRFTDSPLVKKHAFGSIFLLVVLLLISSILYSTISWMWDDKRLPLSKIVLEGDLKYVSSLDVQRAFATLQHVGTFMSQDVKVLQKTVEAIPWVSHASIRKQWPDTVKVFLTEYEAAAIWNGSELLNSQGLVFNGDIGKLEGERVKLYGPAGTSQEVLDVWRQINPKFAVLNLNISSLLLNDRRAWQIILDNGIRLELGKESLEERVERFLSLYKNLGSDSQRVSYIDLRYDTGASVGWFPEQELEQESTDD